MSNNPDQHPGEAGDLWKDPGIFELYKRHRDLFQEVHGKIVQRVVDSNISTDGYIAEMGSGAGHLYSLLPKQYKARSIGIEGTKGFAVIQKKDFPESMVVVGDVYSLPVANESIKGVLSYSVYDTLVDLRKAVSEAGRVLQKGGKFIHFLDLQPNYGLIIKDIPKDQIPFPLYKEGAFNCFNLVSRKDYETKIRPMLHPKMVPIWDLWANDPVNTLGFLQEAGAYYVTSAMSQIIKASDVQKTETETLKGKFKNKLTQELQNNGFKIISDTDVSDTVDVPPNPTHKKQVGKNLFIGDVGQLWTKFDSSIKEGMIREKATLQVVVAEKL